MWRLLSRSLIAFALAWALGGCQAVTGQTIGQNIDDTNLTALVKTQLAADKLSSLSRVNVTTYNSIVSLNGVVESTQAKERAEEIARSVGGVKGVNNNLQIQNR